MKKRAMIATGLSFAATGEVAFAGVPKANATVAVSPLPYVPKKQRFLRKARAKHNGAAASARSGEGGFDMTTQRAILLRNVLSADAAAVEAAMAGKTRVVSPYMHGWTRLIEHAIRIRYDRRTAPFPKARKTTGASLDVQLGCRFNSSCAD